jgi:hypothetical protein
MREIAENRPGSKQLPAARAPISPSWTLLRQLSAWLDALDPPVREDWASAG